MDQAFRLYDFNVYNDNAVDSNSDDSGPKKDANTFKIQMFGLNEKGESCSIIAENFKPFFYVKVGDDWTNATKTSFLTFLKGKVGKYYEDSIVKCQLINKKKLYGFDAGKDHQFVQLTFNNVQCFNKTKNLWYDKERKLLPNGFLFQGARLFLYEANIPPLLRFFHIKDISPSGWVALPKKRTIQISHDKKTTCTYEFCIDYKHILPLNEKETRVPYKICSFDIEASSSHGDFPVPVKSYKKLATNIVEHIENLDKDLQLEECKQLLKEIVLCAFGYSSSMAASIECVYPKIRPTLEEVHRKTDKWLQSKIRDLKKDVDLQNQLTIEDMFDSMHADEEESNSSAGNFFKKPKEHVGSVVDMLLDAKFDREAKLLELRITLDAVFPKLEGDKVTFIGSTFLRAGEKEPYLNHCIALNTCASVNNAEIESYSTEDKVLLAWKDLIQRENPDIIIGYNIFGFDYDFMFHRAVETGCVGEFLNLSKNRGETCATFDQETQRYKLEETKIVIASGEHNLRFIKMNGRIQIDMYNYFRREENLTSYKLDYVAGYFIGDYVKKLEYDATDNKTVVKSTNLTGLLEGSYIHFEEIGHSTDYYSDGAKFIISSVDKSSGTFEVRGNVSPDFSKKVRWCLAKDDVTPKDIFRMTNGTDEDRAIIAKYCLQDCNLVHYLMNKVDVLTGFVEMAKICSVPINFLVLRGQGIKLTSYVAKKCREKNTLMPVMEKAEGDDGYEGAIVLDPKCDLYLDNPVACVDYASLYPSSMISENLSHDSKVWTKEYDLQDNLIKTVGDQDQAGNFIYDNLPEYEYVNITYDTFKYVRARPTAAAEKIKSGYKICRFAQFKQGRAIMPSILEELLAARKATRKMIPSETDEFMKNVLDKRQLGYKVTANSLYGQCGARTSSFYDKDIAASTTATGRMLLTYAKRIIEETYGDAICDTKHGPVLTKAEYIYGDSVANYTPVYVKINDDKYDICTIEDLAKKYGNNNWVTCKELGRQEKEVCELTNVKSWTEKGWTKIHRVIRHKLASHKKMIRIYTSTSVVDVTDDHSLVLPTGEAVSPKDIKIGTQLLHHRLPEEFNSYFDGYINDGDISQLSKAKEVAYKLLNFSSISMVSYDSSILLLNKPKGVSTPEDTILYFTEIPYKGYVYDLTTDNHHFAAGIGNLIVHNTDSVFFTFNLQTPEGQPIRGKKALEITIELAKEAGHLASSFLKKPHDLEYEKTFMPFCLLSKKRYVGMLYEDDPDKCKRKEMGIVLKRRDNAPIVKDIYGGIIDILMKEQDIKKAMEFLQTCLRNIVQENYSMDKLVITKSLRSGYKNPKQIAHKVLADRITSRDPGNKPSSGDRIPFVYIHSPNKKALQGEKIETPTFIQENHLKIDYSFYITNQIMKPVQQIFALVLEKIWAMQNKKAKIAKFRRDMEQLRSTFQAEKLEDKMEKLKNDEIKAMLFDEFLRETNNQKQGNKPLTSFFGKK
uniref:DNA-directed DNA polymerase n=1 Tax=viral metagenome TaxID=1070528 RepID=A0A6C0LEH9_9ZZZZ